MSLDIDLIGPDREVEEPCYACGQLHKTTETDIYFSANITHNLTKMAAAAHIYVHLWHPEDLGIKQAKELIEPLEMAIADMRDRPDFFRQLNAPNGWGTYDQFIPWLVGLLAACKEYPDATISVSR